MCKGAVSNVGKESGMVNWAKDTHPRKAPTLKVIRVEAQKRGAGILPGKGVAKTHVTATETNER